MDSRTPISNRTGPDREGNRASWTVKGLFGYFAVFLGLLLLPVAPGLVAAAIVGATAPKAIAKLDRIVAKRRPNARSMSVHHA